MTHPNTYYKKHSEKYQSEARSLYQKMTLYSILRILIFLLTAVGMYFSYNNWPIFMVIVIIGISSFLILLSKYTDIKEQHQLKMALADINRTELEIASGNFHHREQGLQFQDPLHYYSLDIDLFGRGSFFQFLNRTVIKEGTHQLAEALKANEVADIEKRQNAIKELSSKTEWRQLYSATASLIKVETSATIIIDWLKQHQPFLPKAMQWIPYLFLAGTIGVYLLCFFWRLSAWDF